MKIIIERAHEEDSLELIEVYNKSFYDDYIKFDECPGYNVNIEEMQQRIKNAFMYKIIEDGKIIGAISIRYVGEGYNWLDVLL
jgi:hypothetical protein